MHIILIEHSTLINLYTFSSAVAPRVGIIMGSDSDLPVMKDAAVILDKFDVPYEVRFHGSLFTILVTNLQYAYLS